MVLAAGIGSRLKPLTDDSPKALIEVGGLPMLEIVLKRLIHCGVDAAIINVFHYPDQIAEFLKAKKNFGIHIEISMETELLDTGGGLKKAAYFFDDGRPFFVHNVDVLSGINLDDLYRFHHSAGALATVAVQNRETSRKLLFDSSGALCGRSESDKIQWVKSPVEPARHLAFAGIHVVSSGIFPKLSETGAFPIMQAYLRLAGTGERIAAFNADGYDWLDIGSPQKLDQARRRVNQTGLPL
jgi:NDP-sugar pyrophosphorylase family protein